MIAAAMRLLLRAGSSPFEASRAAPAGRKGHGNSGNILFAHSVYKSLHTPRNRIDVDGYDPDFAGADEINDRYDAYVLPLANAFRPQFEDQLERYTALIGRLKIPCIVVGVGMQAGLDLAELAGAPMDRAVRAFVSAVLDRSPAIGVRGEHTHAYLRKLGFGAVEVIGCPSLYFNGGALGIGRPDGALGGEARIAVNHAPSAGSATAEFARRALADHPNGVFVAQEEANAAAWRRIVPDRVHHFRDVPPWLAFMKTRAFSIGTRIHGNIAALLAGVPAVVIVHDARTEEIVRYHELPHVFAGAIGEHSSAAELFASADVAAANAGASQNFERYRRFLERSGLDHAHDDPRNAADFETRAGTP